MSSIRITQAITLRSEHLPVGTVRDEDPVTAQQLIAAGQAEALTVNPEKPAKKAPPSQPDQE